jgi:antitoxin (DNA-binding transcriptional repressor) of toxin-antitoxin stability system
LNGIQEVSGSIPLISTKTCYRSITGLFLCAGHLFGFPREAGNCAVVFYDKLWYDNHSKMKGASAMPNIKPVSDLRNYTEVLRDIAVGEPVFLTKNGRGRYAIVDIEEYEKTKAVIKLMGELSKSEKSAQEKGWTDISDVEKILGIVNG